MQTTHVASLIAFALGTSHSFLHEARLPREEGLTSTAVVEAAQRITQEGYRFRLQDRGAAADGNPSIKAIHGSMVCLTPSGLLT